MSFRDIEGYKMDMGLFLGSLEFMFEIDFDYVNSRGLVGRSREGFLGEVVCMWNEEEVVGD